MALCVLEPFMTQAVQQPNAERLTAARSFCLSLSLVVRGNRHDMNDVSHAPVKRALLKRLQKRGVRTR
jgi:hypothetical protein